MIRTSITSTSTAGTWTCMLRFYKDVLGCQTVVSGGTPESGAVFETMGYPGRRGCPNRGALRGRSGPGPVHRADRMGRGGRGPRGSSSGPRASPGSACWSTTSTPRTGALLAKGRGRPGRAARRRGRPGPGPCVVLPRPEGNLLEVLRHDRRGACTARAAQPGRASVAGMLLNGRVAIVAGVGPGLGRDIALALARRGRRSGRRCPPPTSRRRRGRRGHLGRCPGRGRAHRRHRTRPAARHWPGGRRAPGAGLTSSSTTPRTGGPQRRLAGADPATLRPVLDVNVLGTLTMIERRAPVHARPGRGAHHHGQHQPVRRRRGAVRRLRAVEGGTAPRHPAPGA